MDEPVYLSVCQAARLLGVSPDAVRRRISRGQLPAVRDTVSRRYRVRWEDVMGQLEEVRIARGGPEGGPPHPSTEAALKRRGLWRFCTR